MKTLKLFSAILAFVLVPGLFISCEKEKEKESTSAACKVTKIAIPGTGNDSAYIYLTYNGSGQLTKYDFGSGLFYTNTWETNKVTVKNYNTNQLTSTEIFILDSDGYAVSSSYALAGAAVSKNSIYEYDGDGYLISKTTTPVSDANKYDVHTYEYTDGNRTSDYQEYFNSTVSPISLSIEYYTTKVNNYDFSKTFLGKANANLIKKSSMSIGTAAPIISNYTYVFETDGKVKKQTMTIETNSIMEIPSYECD